MNSESIVILFNNYQELAIVISIVISILISLSGILPSIFMTGANIMFFGPIYGFIISLLGETIGGYITFIVYRRGFKKIKDKIEGKYKLVDRIIESQGNKAGLLIFEGRLIPFIPSGFITIAASLSKVNSRIFILSTFLGKIPSILLEVLISLGVILYSTVSINIVVTIIAIIFVIATILNYKK